MKYIAATMVLALAFQGCASKPAVASGGMATSATQVLQELDEAATALKRTLTSLQVVTEGRGDMAKSRDAYLADFSDLESRLQAVRQHALDVKQRRDDYLKEWLGKTSTIESASMKAASEKRRTELMTEFMTLGAKAGELRRAYAPLHSSLRDCASFLAADSTPAAGASLASEFEEIRKMEVEVARTGGEYREQLQKIGAMIASSK